jgi:hypothetical protein
MLGEGFPEFTKQAVERGLAVLDAALARIGEGRVGAGDWAFRARGRSRARRIRRSPRSSPAPSPS